MSNFNSLVKLHDSYYTKEFFGKNFKRVLSPLLNSIYDDGGVPQIIGEKDGPVFTSTTATCLLALHYIGILSDDLKRKMQLKLLEMKDALVGNKQVIKKKANEDEVAWCVTEGANVWSTGLALWSLLATKYEGEKLDEIKAATLWLILQQKKDNGWAFQKIESCPSRIYITAIVLHALQMCRKLGTFSVNKRKMIDGAISTGVQFLLDQARTRENMTFWATSVNDMSPDTTSTALALWALYEHNKQRNKS